MKPIGRLIVPFLFLEQNLVHLLDVALLDVRVSIARFRSPNLNRFVDALQTLDELVHVMLTILSFTVAMAYGIAESLIEGKAGYATNGAQCKLLSTSSTVRGTSFCLDWSPDRRANLRSIVGREVASAVFCHRNTSRIRHRRPCRACRRRTLRRHSGHPNAPSLACRERSYLTAEIRRHE